MGIAYDTSGSGTQNSNTTAVTISLTVASGATLLLVGVAINEGADKLDTAVWNGSETCTQIAEENGGAGGMYVSLLGVLNPTSGSHNLVISKTSSCSMDVVCATYTGTSTSALPSVFDTSTLTGSAAGSISAAVTPSGSTSWVAGIGGNNFADGMTVSGSYVIRVDDPAGSSRAWADSNGTVSGLQTVTFSVAGTGDWCEAICVIEPGAGGGGNTTNFFYMT